MHVDSVKSDFLKEPPDKAGEFYCGVCKKQASSKKTFDDHIKSVKHVKKVDKTQFICSICNLFSGSLQLLDDHTAACSLKRCQDISKRSAVTEPLANADVARSYCNTAYTLMDSHGSAKFSDNGTPLVSDPLLLLAHKNSTITKIIGNSNPDTIIESSTAYSLVNILKKYLTKTVY